MFNEAQPCQLSGAGRIIVIGDVHGDLQQFMRCMYSLNLFNQNLEWTATPKNTVVIQLGDQVDSLSRGGGTDWESTSDVDMIYLTDRLDHIAKLHGGRVLSLLGNHELMNTMGDFSYVSQVSQHVLPIPLRHNMFRPGGSIAHILSKRNVIVKIGSHLFCHGGIIPSLYEECKNIHRINQITQKFLRKQPLSPEEVQTLKDTIFSESGILWTRLYMDLIQREPELLIKILDELHSVMNTRKLYVGHNTVPNITAIDQGKLMFVDACLSRAYPTSQIQIVDIFAPDTDQEQIRIVQVGPKNEYKEN